MGGDLFLLHFFFKMGIWEEIGQLKNKKIPSLYMYVACAHVCMNIYVCMLVYISLTRTHVILLH